MQCSLGHTSHNYAIVFILLLLFITSEDRQTGKQGERGGRHALKDPRAGLKHGRLHSGHVAFGRLFTQ